MYSGTRGLPFLVLISLLGIVLLITGAYISLRLRVPAEKQASQTPLKVQREREVEPENLPVESVPVIRPAIPIKPPIVADDAVPVPRNSDSIAVVKTPRSATMPVLKTRVAPRRHDVQIPLTIERIVSDERRTMPIPTSTSTTATLERASGSMPAPALATSAVGRGVVETQIRVAQAPMSPTGLSMIKNISVADAGLVKMALAISIGSKMIVKPLPRGEPGGRIVGRDKDIRGVFRLVRVHHDLSDWWADQSSLVALTEWLNTHTKIKTDMQVEGGALRLTDSKLSKAPLVFFTGHDPAMAKSYELTRDGAFKNRLTEQERDGLRRYLIEDGGFVYFDDCGVNAPAEAFVRLTLAELRRALPEYTVDRIPNDHEIYNNYYDMGGPPLGHDIYWWGTHPPRRNFLEGITVADELRALICRRDYMCAMETLSIPSKTAHYSPGVYRFSTNVIVYALTHGGISDYSKYVPEDMPADRISTDAPILVPRLE